ncbi:MAG: aromatic aminobenezylarsenical efflux permease ArsG family transporter [Tenuifilaceae bacterium]|jgi:cytochrome c biogenesis protein CcdA|nr:aromatic aminobenezylarsenical efflux permease ArsG family transporter [Tenuifilaceae bacterium]
MEFLQNLIDNSQFPLLTAFALGLMTAISPCPLATNISAIGFIGKDVHDKKRVFLNGIIYTLGRAITYSVLGVVLILILRQGSSIFKIQKAVSTYGEMFIGPLLIIIGLFMLDFIKVNLKGSGKLSAKAEEKASGGSHWGALLLGIVFALAFCPYSGVLYFGGLIPLSVSSASGYFLPFVFAIATGLPVIIFSWILAYSVSSIGSVYNKIRTFEVWFRRVVAVVFIGVGMYYTIIVFF